MPTSPAPKHRSSVLAPIRHRDPSIHPSAAPMSIPFASMNETMMLSCSVVEPLFRTATNHSLPSLHSSKLAPTTSRLRFGRPGDPPSSCGMPAGKKAFSSIVDGHVQVPLPEPPVPPPSGREPPLPAAPVELLLEVLPASPHPRTRSTAPQSVTAQKCACLRFTIRLPLPFGIRSSVPSVGPIGATALPVFGGPVSSSEGSSSRFVGPQRCGQMSLPLDAEIIDCTICSDGEWAGPEPTDWVDRKRVPLTVLQRFTSLESKTGRHRANLPFR